MADGKEEAISSGSTDFPNLRADSGSSGKKCEADLPSTADDSSITMLDVLEEEKELEDDANAVLGGSDDQNCTYIQGYVKRQALYACSTCSGPDMEPGGLCLACSYACHDGHALYELYTKRNFRCDCGNSRFPNNPCILFPAKDPQNPENCYNHNFSGRYCTCQRPYPDMEDDIPDEMVQCIMCEDWYHGRHLAVTIPDNHDYSEVICSECTEKYPFLRPYHGETTVVKMEETKGSVDVLGLANGNSSLSASDSQEENPIQGPKQTDCSLVVQFHETSSLDSGIELGEDEKRREPAAALKEEKPDFPTSSYEDSQECYKEEHSTEACILKLLQRTHNRESTSEPWTLFLREGWRQRLCRCAECLDMYKKHKCIFLLDSDDTVHAYEEKGKAKTGTQSHYDLGLSALQRLDRVRQIEAIHGYNNMKSELKEFLQKFANSRKVVREEDIKEFFEQMNARKRQKLECQIPHFCR